MIQKVNGSWVIDSYRLSEILTYYGRADNPLWHPEKEQEYKNPTGAVESVSEIPGMEKAKKTELHEQRFSQRRFSGRQENPVKKQYITDPDIGHYIDLMV